jgi:hypothetical protein
MLALSSRDASREDRVFQEVTIGDVGGLRLTE